MNSLVTHTGNVEIEGIAGDDILISTTVKTTSKVLAEGVHVAREGNEIIITVTSILCSSS